MLESILTTTETGSISLESMALCTLASLILGLVAAGIYQFRNTYSKSFLATLALLPLIIQVIIMLVNGNLGTGVAVMGAFSLVRFRSAPGSAREIGAIFLAMALGLATGMGYIACAVMVLLVVGAAWILFALCGYGESRSREKELRITIPETLDYTNVFDDLFSRYTRKIRLMKVKTSNLGSLYDLQYQLVLKDDAKEKEFIDELRCRNGNLSIVCGHISSANREEL